MLIQNKAVFVHIKRYLNYNNNYNCYNVYSFFHIFRTLLLKGGKVVHWSMKSANFFDFKLAKQGALILLFFNIFETNHAHEGMKWGFKIKIMSVLHVHKRH